MNVFHYGVATSKICDTGLTMSCTWGRILEEFIQQTVNNVLDHDLGTDTQELTVL